MVIKEADDRTADLLALEALRSHPWASAPSRQRIDQELRQIRSGIKGEKEAAYEIDFHLRPSRRWAVIHDLRLEVQGRVAQIDHLLVNRFLDIWLCESKHFAEGVMINEQGEFAAFYEGRPVGIGSPIEQNRKHKLVLETLLSSGVFQLPSRLGMALKPTIYPIVLVSKRARISRPKAKVDGLDDIIKADQLRSLIERRYEQASVGSTLLSATKVVSEETMESFTRQLAGFHRPISYDWQGKFGLTGRPREFAATGPAGLSLSKPDARAEDPNSGRVSTSKLATKLGYRTAGQLIEKLAQLGYLERVGDAHVLTAKGSACGAVFVEKSRYGPYFLWPEGLNP